MENLFRQNKKDPSHFNHYKWGFLYFDPADHRVFVPKKVAWMGWTLNFASPFSIVVIAGIIALVWWINKVLGGIF